MPLSIDAQSDEANEADKSEALLNSSVIAVPMNSDNEIWSFNMIIPSDILLLVGPIRVIYSSWHCFNQRFGLIDLIFDYCT